MAGYSVVTTVDSMVEKKVASLVEMKAMDKCRKRKTTNVEQQIQMMSNSRNENQGKQLLNLEKVNNDNIMYLTNRAATI